MKKNDLVRLFQESDMFIKWHWFSWHFRFYSKGLENPFAKALVDAILNIDKKVENFATTTVKHIASISGKEKYEPHYCQLLQVCSEIYVLNQAVQFFGDRAIFEYEPTSGDSKKILSLLLDLKIILLELK